VRYLGFILALIVLTACGSGSSSPGTGGGGGQSTISGTISPANLGSGVQLSLTGGGATTANALGAYTFSGVADGTYTVTPASSAATFSPVSAQVTVSGANVSGVNFTATSANAGAFFFDDFNGSSLSSAWTVIQRRGPSSQGENECNTAGAVAVSGGNVNITTSATPATCGDAVSSPTQLPYTSGDIQWTNLNFTYGTVEVRAKFPPQNTKTWPAIWLLGSNCQAANIINGSEADPFNGCPAQGDSAYREIDMVECDTRGWCHMVLAQGTNGWGPFCNFAVDANFHVFKLTWTASTLTLAIDGAAPVCTYTNNSIKGPMFLIMQTQTTVPGGPGPPDNTKLPTTFQIDYVKVTQP
jgi:beta-glucanase (GH16 family)